MKDVGTLVLLCGEDSSLCRYLRDRISQDRSCEVEDRERNWDLFRRNVLEISIGRPFKSTAPYVSSIDEEFSLRGCITNLSYDS